jgi:hypothetical protein
MDMDFNNDNALQDPEALRRQTEIINYAVAKRTTALEKIFGSKMAILKEKQQEALINEHFKHELEDYTIFRKMQGASLKKFLEESFMRLAGNQALRTAESLKSDESAFMDALHKSELQFYDLIDEQDAKIATIKNPQTKKNAEEQLKKIIDKHYQTVDLITEEFHKKIASTATK